MHILVHIISSRPQSSQRGPGSDSDSKDEEHEAQQTRNPVDKKPVDFTRSLGPKLKSPITPLNQKRLRRSPSSLEPETAPSAIFSNHQTRNSFADLHRPFNPTPSLLQIDSSLLRNPMDLSPSSYA
ncbi:hypothetical protein C1H46_003100 [Malus baccata]|uniref:Uncharacterized protein n=1 Tax=Malus baccata TaxID=106549 RepID=A0A540NK09_MALBA|nr:hypothetical protein C1H46_003100 [Malus baccata]